MLAWVEQTGRVITDIYITHGHGDHWLGAPVVLDRFPDAVVRATAGTKAHIAGDVVYNGVHLALIESAGGGRDAWRRALDKVEALGAEFVVASHKDPDREASTTPTELFDGMTRLHPERINPGILWFGALTLVDGGSAQ